MSRATRPSRGVWDESEVREQEVCPRKVGQSTRRGRGPVVGGGSGWASDPPTAGACWPSRCCTCSGGAASVGAFLRLRLGLRSCARRRPRAGPHEGGAPPDDALGPRMGRLRRRRCTAARRLRSRVARLPRGGRDPGSHGRAAAGRWRALLPTVGTAATRGGPGGGGASGAAGASCRPRRRVIEVRRRCLRRCRRRRGHSCFAAATFRRRCCRCCGRGG